MGFFSTMVSSFAVPNEIQDIFEDLSHLSDRDFVSTVAGMLQRDEIRHPLAQKYRAKLLSSNESERVDLQRQLLKLRRSLED